MGVLVGGVTGGIGGGISNVIGGKGLNIWTGKPNNMEVGVPRITQFGNRVVEGVDDAASVVNQTSKAVLKNGYYEVNGFKFSEYYYNKLWSTGRGAPSLVAKEILEGGAKTAVSDAIKAGFYKYIYGGWEMIYNPTTKEVWPLLPLR
ncbi:hypothetical protein [Parapedobacter koreensis]|uniref:Uncharacterized protein n=1 Tax=Parapedobacter koreensis TaxID=332977 RepID=A0A1H7IPZ3_9SPHI|nr:hypothetical protein [Parapedobacter koreensis]SEK63787.1 hypothetical protein SAMN05421740_102299 [Parapedobacter koreensis]